MEEKVERVLLRPAEAAAMIGVSRSKVYELISCGALPAIRLDGGRLLRVPIAAIRKLAACAGVGPGNRERQGR